MREFSPDPKPIKAIKVKVKSSHKNMYKCSDGDKLTESQIQSRLSRSYRDKHEDNPNPLCEGCGVVKAQDNSHFISQKRLKQLHKTELIYSPEAYCSYCRSCHQIIEGYKSGEFANLLNVIPAMQFIRKHDLELYNKMLNYGE